MKIYCFESFTLNLSKRELSYNQKIVSIERKTFQLLAVLVLAQGRLVTKDELLNKIWEDTIVEEANVAVQISKLRNKIEETSGDDSYNYIQKDKDKDGYRFIKLVTISEKYDDEEMAEKTYLIYRDKPITPLFSLDLMKYFEDHYGYELVRLAGRPMPASIIWQNREQLVDPDDIIEKDYRPKLIKWKRSTYLDPPEYKRARNFIKHEFESDPSPIRYEGMNYRMTSIDLPKNPSKENPKFNGVLGRYYDSILTQYILEWELQKAFYDGKLDCIANIREKGTLPLREAVELACSGNPILNGAGRCASSAVSTLLIFQNMHGGFNYLLRRRSAAVGVGKGLYHVAPSGMLETPEADEPWSIKMNIWRELLEEVYNDKKQQGRDEARKWDSILGELPVELLVDQLIPENKAELSVVGICCDLWNLRPEICVVLFVKDFSFAKSREMILNYEWKKKRMGSKKSVFSESWSKVDTKIEEIRNKIEAGKDGICPAGIACLVLGREWMRERHKM